MKNILTAIICLLTLRVTAQQKMNKFQIVDSLSGKPVPSASVTLVRAKLSINTEKDGIFIIPGDLAVLRDTVIFYAQNYRPEKLLLEQLNGRDTIRLARHEDASTNTSIKYNADTLLNDYLKRDIVHFAGVNTTTAKFEYLQLAQQFYASKPGVVLKSVKLNRLAFAMDTTDYTWMPSVHLDKVKFRMRIYDIDPITHGPGHDLCNKTIEISKIVGSQITVDLKKYKIVVPHKTFFVAVEWMRDFYNAGYSVSVDQEGKQTRELNYHPLIGIAATTGPTLNIWAQNFKREWKPYTYFMPFGTDLAMSAVIAY
ncbi:hypothetical protein [Mucilaginibacter sp. dw_454]|uniref:hypothetical protein n=1 Tax=Mucilaginibacter sp. dw_454 TaxID=2720079 RepID=UPI001BD1F763|nr:hypothetical protein [Mucilaginibacter sp. dw_454]